MRKVRLAVSSIFAISALNVVMAAGSEDKVGTAIDTPKFLSGFVNIPAGSYMMGSGDEKPIHRVSLNAFKMMANEVTWSQYQPCINAGVCPNNDGGEDGGDAGWGKDNRPVINVSYRDVVNHYLPWLQKQTGLNFRLPSESEWEYGAKAGKSTPFSTGDCIHTRQANYDGNYNWNNCGSKTGVFREKTLPVGSFSPNAFGLYDMHGNVSEWTQDCVNIDYHGAPTDGRAWITDNCKQRIVRGGSWYDRPIYIRSAARDWNDVTYRYSDLGFRLVLDAKE